MALSQVTVERLTGMDVGCKRDALAAITGSLKECGRGLHRTVYVDARSRFIYKLEGGRDGRNPFHGNGANRKEYVAFTCGELAKRGLARFGSPVALFTVRMPDGTVAEVLAMPFRPSDSHNAPRGEARRFRALGGEALPDMHGANYRVTANGRIKITDLGFGMEF